MAGFVSRVSHGAGLHRQGDGTWGQGWGRILQDSVEAQEPALGLGPELMGC